MAAGRRKMRTLRMMFLALAALVMTGALPILAQSKWEATKTVHIGGDGAWDYAVVDAQSHRLFVTRSTHTQAIDTSTGKVVGDIPGQIRSHGTALVPALNRGFITDGGGNGAILVFDLKTYALVGKLATMPDSDGIIYDPATDLVLAVSGDGQKLMTFKPNIDPAHGTIDSPIELGGSPEFLAASGDGKAYVNLEDKDLVAVVDLKTRKVIARWPVAPGGHPVGMAIDRRNHLLFIGCRNPQKMIVMSTVDGKVVADLPIGAGVDATKVDGDQAFASCGDGTLTVIGKKDGKYEVEQVVKTANGARTMAVDPSTHILYLPTAEMEPPAQGQRRPTAKPDTFMIVEVGQAAR
jgi:DNA-binding beta-propeller fold protein YncE